MKFKVICAILILLITYVVGKGIITGELNHDYTQELADLNTTPTPTNNDVVVWADLNGDGVKEKLTAIESTQNSIKTMVAVSSGGKLIGALPDDISLPFPSKDFTQVIKLNSDVKNEYLAMGMVTGPHQSITVVFGLIDDGRILPVCKTQSPKNIFDCAFWSGEVGRLQFADLDNDKNLEVVEYVDEYPLDGILNNEELKAVNSNQYNKTYQSTMTRIAKREKGGRGRKVVWAIYKYDNGIFKEMVGKNYDKIYELAVTSHYIYQSSPIKKSQMSKSSIDFNEFVYKVWTGQKVD